MKQYDVVVIGSGVGGLTAAYELQSAGKKVAVIEENLWGGTCPNRGCDPKKILLAAVEARDRVVQLQGKGFVEVPPIDWPALMAFKESFTEPVSHDRQQGFVAAGIDTYSGTARFLSEDQLEVAGQQLQAQQFLIATGQRPALLAISGQEQLLTSTDFLALPEMPARIAFLGAGYIAFELATIANAAGAEVHIVHHNKHPLKGFDTDLSLALVAQLQERGIKFHFDTEVSSLQQKADGFLLQGSGDFSLAIDQVVCAAGRLPNLEHLNLAAAGVAYSDKGITVNEFLATTNPRIYACGDILEKQQPKLTPVAVFEGRYAAQHMRGQTAAAIRYPLIPTICYGSPKLAQVGLTTAAGEQAGYQVKDVDMTDWFTYRRLNEPKALAKLVFDQEQRLQGACLLSGQADELINFLALAITSGWQAADIANQIMGYPTAASDLEYLL